ncbi:MAG: diacylglycerol kinase family protein [Candidatus Eisenbacteria bacterium]
MLVLLNSRAGRGRAGELWRRVRPEVEARLGALDTADVASPESVTRSVSAALAAGERVFIAAGGDGTVNSVAGALLRAGAGSDAAMGAVGLGSSNDFHKTPTPGKRLCGLPVRIDCSSARPQDVIRIELENEGGERELRYAVMNASLGITAEANARFNSASALVSAAGRLSMNAAIVASVIETLVAFRDVPCRIRIDDGDETAFSVSNLGVVKNPHFAGTFCYDTAIEPDDGQLGVNLCERLNAFQALATLAALSRRKFEGRPKTRTWSATRVRVDSERTFALETDGEVTEARGVSFEVLPRALRCCA